MNKILSKHTRTRLIWREGKKVRAHRWIMEQHLNRKLEDWEEVHHINHDPLDNRLENLIVMGRKSHSDLHAKEKQKYPDKKKCELCADTFIVNPRKRKRNKCCSKNCAQKMRVTGRKKQAGALK